MDRRKSLMNCLRSIFKEMGLEKTMQFYLQDFKEGRRASVINYPHDVLSATQQQQESSSDTESD